MWHFCSISFFYSLKIQCCSNSIKGTIFPAFYLSACWNFYANGDFVLLLSSFVKRNAVSSWKVNSCFLESDRFFALVLSMKLFILLLWPSETAVHMAAFEVQQLNSRCENEPGNPNISQCRVLHINSLVLWDMSAFMKIRVLVGTLCRHDSLH